MNIHNAIGLHDSFKCWGPHTEKEITTPVFSKEIRCLFILLKMGLIHPCTVSKQIISRILYSDSSIDCFLAE